MSAVPSSHRFRRHCLVLALAATLGATFAQPAVPAEPLPPARLSTPPQSAPAVIGPGWG